MPKGKNQRPIVSRKVERGLKQDIQRMAKMAGVEVEEVDASMPGAKLDRWLPTARKVPFTMQWFRDHYPLVKFLPEENLPVTINGVKVNFLVDTEVEVPAPFVAEYHRYRKEVRSMGRSGLRAGSALPEGVVGVIPGAGGLPPQETEGG